MRFAVGQAFKCTVDGRQAVISEIRDDGRSGRLRFLDTGQQQWVFWAQFHNTGKWLAMGLRELEPTSKEGSRRCV
jgi:hypothetical protein